MLLLMAFILRIKSLEKQKINMKNLFNKIKQNSLMMILCCAMPIIILVIVVYFFGLNNKYLSWFIILLCPILHYFMMRDMHKKDRNENNKKVKCH